MSTEASMTRTIMSAFAYDVRGLVFVAQNISVDVDATTPNANETEIAHAALVESQFTSILVLNFVILAAAITAFVILRRVAPVFYAPVLRPEYRYNWPEADAVWPNNEPPIPPPDTLFGWIPHVWRYSLDRMLGSHGLDAVVALAFLKLSFQQFLVAAAYGIVVLLPIHIFSPIPDPQDGLLRLTMANIENGSSLLWFHVVGIYVYSFVTYYAMFNLYRKYAAWRIHVMQRTMASNYTVLVRSLPRRTPKGAPFGDHHLRHMFEFLYPGEIVSARVVRHMPKTAKLRAERLEAARQLERAASQIGIDQGALEFGGSGYPPEALAAWKKRAASASRMSVKINKRLGLFGGERVDAIRHWRGEVERIGDEIQKSSALEVRNLTGNALVTFTSIQRAAQVKQLLFERRTFKFHVGPAPTPRDLLWLQFNLSPLMIRVRVLLVTVVVLLLTFFWAIPIAFVTGVVRLDSLARIFVSIGLPEVADAISDIPVALSGFLTSVVPVLIVSVFLSLVPAILRVLVRLEGAVSYNEVEKTVMDRYHTFILVNVFVTATLSGAIVDILSFVKEIADNPTLLATLLGTAVPAQAFFFTFYVAQAAIGALVLEVLRITGLIKGYVLRFLAKSARDYRDAFAPGPPPHAEALARHMLFFTINLTFSIATPLILPFSVMYYALGYLFDKYNLLYVYVPVAHGNGVMFESIITRSFVGLAIFQIACVGMMGAKLAQVQAPFVILLLPITYLAHQQIVSLFRAPSRHLNMVESTALQADHRGSHGGQFMGAYANTVLSDDPICQRILKNLRGTEAEVHDRLLDDGKFVPADRRPDLATMIDDDIEMGQQHTELLRQQAELRSREATNMTQDSGDEKHSTSSDDHFVVESAETTAELF